MWLHEKHGIWISVNHDCYYYIEMCGFGYIIREIKTNKILNNTWFFETPTEAYTQAILKTLKEII